MNTNVHPKNVRPQSRGRILAEMAIAWQQAKAKLETGTSDHQQLTSAQKK